MKPSLYAGRDPGMVAALARRLCAADPPLRQDLMMPISDKPEIGRGQRGSADDPRFRGTGLTQSAQGRLLCRREDVLDSSFRLRQPSDYSMDQGARSEVHIEKGRGVFGEHARPFEAWLAVRDCVAFREFHSR